MTLDFYEWKLARAYTAVALLADRCGLCEHPQVQAALDFFSDPAAPDGDWSLQDAALQPGTDWQGEPAAPVVDTCYWG
jgi:hypothetical protein